MQIPLAEHFYSIQGEGRHAGTPAVFLRLAGCNLCCGGRENLSRAPDEFSPEDGASWVCDTIDVWRDASATPTASELVDEWGNRGYLDHLDQDAHLVVTGGEPLLPQNRSALTAVCAELSDRGVDPFVEVETNGTVTPTDAVVSVVDLFNVSLKLSNSGMPDADRLVPDALSRFATIAREEPAAVVFKYVVGDDGDIAEIHSIMDTYGLTDIDVMLMPAGQTRSQLSEVYPRVVELCKRHGWRFSPRLHVEVWNEQTGV